MDKKMENEMETGIIHQDPPCTLNWGYMVPNSRYLGRRRVYLLWGSMSLPKLFLIQIF